MFQVGHKLHAVLRSDVVATQITTRALVEVFDGTGRSLGMTLVNVSLKPQLRNRVSLEGAEIVKPDGKKIRGRFGAFSPDGSEGLIGTTRKHLFAYLGLTLYKTTLGVLALRLAENDNTLAGIIGVQAGSQIFRDLAGEHRDKGIPKTVLVPRGTTFHILFFSSATVDDGLLDPATELDVGLNPSSERLTALRQEQERRLQALSRYFRDLESRQGIDNPNMGLTGALKNPAYLELLEEDRQ